MLFKKFKKLKMQFCRFAIFQAVIPPVLIYIFFSFNSVHEKREVSLKDDSRQ